MNWIGGIWWYLDILSICATLFSLNVTKIPESFDLLLLPKFLDQFILKKVARVSFTRVLKSEREFIIVVVTVPMSSWLNLLFGQNVVIATNGHRNMWVSVFWTRYVCVIAVQNVEEKKNRERIFRCIVGQEFYVFSLSLCRNNGSTSNYLNPKCLNCSIVEKLNEKRCAMCVYWNGICLNLQYFWAS